MNFKSKPYDGSLRAKKYALGVQSETELASTPNNSNSSIKMLQQSNDRINKAKSRRMNKVMTIFSGDSETNDLDTNFTNNCEHNNMRIKIFDTSLASNWSKPLKFYYRF